MHHGEFAPIHYTPYTPGNQPKYPLRIYPQMGSTSDPLGHPKRELTKKVPLPIGPQGRVQHLILSGRCFVCVLG